MKKDFSGEEFRRPAPIEEEFALVPPPGTDGGRPVSSGSIDGGRPCTGRESTAGEEASDGAD